MISGLAGRLLQVPIIAASLFAGWQLRWLLDDGYISFRYAWNLAHGHGLVFNPGELPPVEGYTNFLWTVLMALPIGLGLDPTYPALFLNMVFGAGALFATRQVALRTIGTETGALIAVFLVGSNYTFLCFLTPGLETQMQTCLIAVALWLAIDLTTRGWSAVRLLGLSVCGGAALLTRLDSAVFGLVIFVWLMLALGRERAGGKETARRLTLLLLPAAAIVGVWLVWKLRYYGDLLPNTWYARTVGLDSWFRWRRGLSYVAGFVTDYWLWPFLLWALVAVNCWKRPVCALMLSIPIVWWGYVVHSGADYMEYRFMVPVLPALFSALLAVAYALRRTAVPLFVVTMLSASAFHGRVNDGTPIGHGRLGRELLALEDPAHNVWSELERLVARDPELDDVVWAFPALGYAGYYTRFRVADVHGLTDRYVARNGLVRNESPGHDKYAPLSYLRERGVTLADSFGDPCYWHHFYDAEELAGEELIRIGPMLFWYVNPHPAVDRLVAERGERLPLPPRRACPGVIRR